MRKNQLIQRLKQELPTTPSPEDRVVTQQPSTISQEKLSLAIDRCGNTPTISASCRRCAVTPSLSERDDT